MKLNTFKEKNYCLNVYSQENVNKKIESERNCGMSVVKTQALFICNIKAAITPRMLRAPLKQFVFISRP